MKNECWRPKTLKKPRKSNDSQDFEPKNTIWNWEYLVFSKVFCNSNLFFFQIKILKIICFPRFFQGFRYPKPNFYCKTNSFCNFDLPFLSFLVPQVFCGLNLPAGEAWPETQKRQKTQKTQTTQFGIAKTISVIMKNECWRPKTCKNLRKSSDSQDFELKSTIWNWEYIVFSKFFAIPICVFSIKILKIIVFP